MACCSGDAHEHLADQLHELALDPTLQDCCRRDLEEQAREATIKGELLSHDRTQLRQVLAAQVIRREAGPAAGQHRLEAHEDTQEEEGDELERLRALRMRELRAQALQNQQPAGSTSNNQHGDVKTLHSESSAWEALKAPGTVCHLTLEGVPVCEAMDECLAALARKLPSVRFIRCVVQPISRLHNKLDLHPGPAIVCCTRKGGQKVGENELNSASLALFGAPHDLRDDKVEAWVLKHLKHHSVGHDDIGENTSDEDNETEEGEACSVCGRTYPHEHVRSVFRGVDHEDSSSEDDDVL